MRFFASQFIPHLDKWALSFCLIPVFTGYRAVASQCYRLPRRVTFFGHGFHLYSFTPLQSPWLNKEQAA
jgi:hypothetical protein